MKCSFLSGLKCPPRFLSSGSLSQKAEAFSALTLTLIHNSYYTQFWVVLQEYTFIMALHGSSFCLNGNLSFKEFNSLPCACYSSRMLHHLSLPSRKYNLVVANTLERGHRFQFLPGDGRLKLRTEQSTSSLPTSGLRSLKPCSAKCDDSKDSSVSKNIILDAETLTRDLDIAIAEENYAKAAEIRDRLRLLREDSMTSVLAANSRFYESFRIGDLAAMQSLWAKRDEVCCVHPGARGIYGYEDVMTSWDYVWANYEFPLQIELKDVNANVRGDMGFVSCVELVKTKGSSWGGQFVTNVFERIDGQWFISVHHASPIDL